MKEGVQGHMKILEQGDANKAALLQGLDSLLNISFVPDDEVLKICLDFWHFFVPDVYDSLMPGGPGANSLASQLSGASGPLSPTQACHSCICWGLVLSQAEMRSRGMGRLVL